VSVHNILKYIKSQLKNGSDGIIIFIGHTLQQSLIVINNIITTVFHDVLYTTVRQY